MKYFEILSYCFEDIEYLREIKIGFGNCEFLIQLGKKIGVNFVDNDKNIYVYCKKEWRIIYYYMLDKNKIRQFMVMCIKYKVKVFKYI